MQAPELTEFSVLGEEEPEPEVEPEFEPGIVRFNSDGMAIRELNLELDIEVWRSAQACANEAKVSLLLQPKAGLPSGELDAEDDLRQPFRGLQGFLVDESDDELVHSAL